MYNLNAASVTNSFIKQLLTDISLPNLIPVTYGDYILKGVTYLYNQNVIRCTRSGIISGLQAGYLCSEDSICDVGFICGVGVPLATYDIVESYLYTGLVPGKTSQFHSPKSYYDVETHHRLGEFLRWYRSVYSIDLMSLYNCFFPETTEEVSISRVEGKFSIVNEPSAQETTVYKVPVKFNTSYAVYFSNSCTLNWSLCFLRNGGVLKVGDISSFRVNGSGVENSAELSDEEKQQYVHQVIQYNPHRTTLGGIHKMLAVSTSITDYNVLPSDSRKDTEVVISGTDLHSLHRYLYLIIEVPKSYSGNIVILENVQVKQADKFRVNANISNYVGEGTLYKENKVKEWVEHSLVDDASSYESTIPLRFEKVSPASFINELQHFSPVVNPSLLNSDRYEPFSDKLLSYLIESTITSQEDIPHNIKRIQEKIGEAKGTPDVWGEFLSPQIYSYYFNKPNVSNYDILGYVDKDVEDALFN